MTPNIAPIHISWTNGKESVIILFSSLPLPILLVIFVVGASAVWVAGIQLSNTTDVLSSRFGFGEALGGLLFLAITTNLPEIAITTSAALTHNLGIAIGNILGGIGIQTVVLVVLDAFGLGSESAFTYRAASLELVLEGVLVVAVLIVSIMSTQFPSWLYFARISPGSLLIAILWIVGLLLLRKARTDLPWQDKGRAPGRVNSSAEPTKSDKGQNGQDGKSDKKQGGQNAKSTTKDKQQNERNKQENTARAIIVFVIASIVTLIAGVALELSGDAISKDIGLSGVLFGATFLAAATALPELSTGLESVKIRDYELAMSDIFGGNAFLPVLFLLADILSGEAVLPQAHNSDIYLAGLGILLTTVYIYGLIFRPRRQILRMGIDSLVVLILYVLGMVGLIALAHK